MRKTLLSIASTLLALLMYSCGGGGAHCYAQMVTLTGTLQGSNGTTAANYTINFQPTQMFFVAGTGVVVNTSSACATSIDGSVVGLGNPLTSTIVSPIFSGTLPVGNYYVEYSFYTAAGETLVGPETAQQLTSPGSLTVAPPTSGIPSTALGMRVYIGASSGSETLQGQTTGSASFVQSGPLVSGTAPRGVNSTICQQVANDTGWPTGTGYRVSLTDTNGNVMPGYPMVWQLMGAGSTINLSNGLPYYNGVVYYPSPIMASPLNHATQSISGGLNLTGYWLSNAGRIGIGTSNPAYPVDVENGFINSNLGLLLNGSAGIAGQCHLSGGPSGPQTWGSCSGTLPTLYYQTVQGNGTAFAQQPVLSFSSPLVVTAGTGMTTVGLQTLGTGGTYTNPASITTDAYGRVTAVTEQATGSGTDEYISFAGPDITGSGGSNNISMQATATFSPAEPDTNYVVVGCVVLNSGGATDDVTVTSITTSNTFLYWLQQIENNGGNSYATTINCHLHHP